jgi:hypothetical protein
MKFVFRKLLSIPEDGASCVLLTFEEKHKVLLDCGISRDFGFQKYRDLKEELKDVRLVLISHSALEYSGGYPFLVSELGLNPKIFYTTQPIMRYAPLSIHEELLSLRIPSYNRKIFNRIYSFFEEMQLVKPHQKKEMELGEEGKALQFACYLAGGSLASLYWRISYGLVNIVYLVGYNNYAMNHIAGLEMESLSAQPTHLLITDGYARKSPIKRNALYRQLMQTLLTFYERNNMEPNKPKLFSQQDQQLLIVCSPSELLVELLFVLCRVVNELNEGNSYEKIGVIHLSSRFLELVKSQSEYFTLEFKTCLEKMNENFEQNTSLRNRINVCSIHSYHGILGDSARHAEVHFIGPRATRLLPQQETPTTRLNVASFHHLFGEEEERLIRSASKISLSKAESKLDMEPEEKIEEQVSLSPQSVKEEALDDEMEVEDNKVEKKNFNNKYIAFVWGIPRFNLNTREKSEEITELGLRYHAADDLKNKVKTIYQMDDEAVKPLTFEEKLLTKKQSKV